MRQRMVGSEIASCMVAALAAIWATLLVPAAAVAQSSSYLPIQPPVVQMVDKNNIDLLGPGLTYRLPLLSIGPAGPGGLSFEAIFNGSSPSGWSTNLIGSVTVVGSGPIGQTQPWISVSVGAGGHSEAFNLQGSCSPSCVYVSVYGTGSTLTVDTTGHIFTYTVSDGTVYKLTFNLGLTNNQLTEIDYPTGEVVTFSYVPMTVTQNGYTSTYNRLQSVTTSTGYGIHFDYGTNSDPSSFMTMLKATGWNMAVEYCGPTAASCSFTQSWPTAIFNYSGFSPSNVQPTSITDAAGLTTTFGYSAWLDTGGYYLQTIQKPSGWKETIGYTNRDGCDPNKSPCHYVGSVTYGAGTWNYTNYISQGSSPGITNSVIDPLGNIRTLTTGPGNNCLVMANDQDALGRSTAYLCDTSHRITQVTLPEHGYTKYDYDTRGNVTGVTKVPKPGSNLPNIIMHAVYDDACTPQTQNKCNKPNSITDGRNYTTTYTYDNGTGLLLEVQGPVVSVGASNIQPTTVYNYAQVPTKALSSPSQLSTVGSVWKLTSTATCATSVASVPSPLTMTSPLSCGGGAVDEVMSTTSYDGSNNALPTSVTSGVPLGTTGPRVTSSTAYDNVGNVSAVVGPLGTLGSDFTTKTWYNGMRQKVGVVGPKPDPANGLLYRAQHILHSPDGLVSEVDRGTATGYDNPDASGSSFGPKIKQVTAYDTVDRKSQDEVMDAGGTIYQVTQYGYDLANRLLCTAVRMNQSAFATLPVAADPCLPWRPSGSDGPDGPDRITHNSYDAANEITAITTGYATAAQRDEKKIYLYSDDGLPRVIGDGDGNLTTLAYDELDRLNAIEYPNPSGGGSSNTDIERYDYDNNSNVQHHTMRDQSVIGFTYDGLNRKLTKTPPESANAVSYGYDLLGHLTSEGFTNNAALNLTYQYDALGRKVKQTGPFGQVQSTWDDGGRRTQLKWPDGNFITYTYDKADEMVNVEQNNATSGPGLLASFSYDDLGNRTGVTRGNGVSTAYSHDGAGRLTSLVHAGVGNTQGYNQIHYNAAGEMTSFTTTNGAYAWTGASALNQSYAVNGLNQYTSVGAAPYSYDLRANLKTLSSGGAVYGYDTENRLTSMTGSPGAILGYYADGTLWKIVGSATTQFLYDGDQIIGEYDGSGALQRRYVPGPGIDEPLVWYEHADLATPRWLLANHQGSVIAWADTSSSIPNANINTYDEYGQPGSSNSGRFQYTGQAWLPEVAAYDYRARNYLPSIGRFMQTDPKGYDAGMNLYAYASDDPVDHSDPSGLSWLSDAWDYTKGLAGEIWGDVEAGAVPEIPGSAAVKVTEEVEEVAGAGSAEEEVAAAGANREPGSYTTMHESGKVYEGKGPRVRSELSGRRIEKETGDKHVATHWEQAESDREAFKQESRKLENSGGAKSDKTHNKIDSPGTKYRRQDGEPATPPSRPRSCSDPKGPTGAVSC